MDQANALTTFAVMAVVGILLGLVYDTYRGVRRWCCLGRTMTAVGDLLYWLFAASITFFVLVLCNHGELRAFVFIAISIGMYSYFRLCSDKILLVLSMFFRKADWMGRELKQNRNRINLFLKRGKTK